MIAEIISVAAPPIATAAVAFGGDAVRRRHRRERERLYRRRYRWEIVAEPVAPEPAPEVEDTFWEDVVGIPLDEWAAAGMCHGPQGYTFPEGAIAALVARREAGEFAEARRKREEPPRTVALDKYLAIAVDPPSQDDPYDKVHCPFCGGRTVVGGLDGFPRCIHCRRTFFDRKPSREQQCEGHCGDDLVKVKNVTSHTIAFRTDRISPSFEGVWKPYESIWLPSRLLTLGGMTNLVANGALVVLDQAPEHEAQVDAKHSHPFGGECSRCYAADLERVAEQIRQAYILPPPDPGLPQRH